MEEIKLDVQVRKEIGSQRIKAVRAEDLIPAIVYGGSKKPTAVKIDRRTFERIRRQHEGESIILHLNVLEGEKKLRDYSVIVREEQHDPVSDRIQHIDFKRISLKEEIEVKIPVKTVGEAIGVKKGGGSLDHHIWELDVVCLPTNMPEHIDIDVSALEIGDAVHVKDLALPEGVKTKHDEEDIVVSVVPPMKEEEEEPAETDEDAEPELVGEKEKEEKAEEAPAEEEKKEEPKEGE